MGFKSVAYPKASAVFLLQFLGSAHQPPAGDHTPVFSARPFELHVHCVCHTLISNTARYLWDRMHGCRHPPPLHPVRKCATRAKGRTRQSNLCEVSGGQVACRSRRSAMRSCSQLRLLESKEDLQVRDLTGPKEKNSL